MPQESAVALLQFVIFNPQMQGAGWDDCLDRLLDADAHLSLTEPLYEEEPTFQGALPAAVAITLYYASKAFAESSPTDQAMFVLATIQNNGGAS
jgi:hypothetical protein